jgi:hypothetical protein
MYINFEIRVISEYICLSSVYLNEAKILMIFVSLCEAKWEYKLIYE